MPSDIDLGLLGPTSLTVADRPVPVPAGRQQVALAALAHDVGRPVSSTALVEHLWGEQPPAQVRQALHTTMARLRKLVGADRVVARGGGYALDLPEEAVDVHRFRAGVARARAAGDQDQEKQALTEALTQWRGQPLEGVDSDSLCGEHVYPLTEEWFAATERLVELRLRDGESADVVGELRGLIARHPLRESLWCLLMSALAASGRQADALAAYQEIRTALRDELGVDPGPDLVATHQAVLDGSAAPVGRTTPEPVVAPNAPPPVPHQVPAAPRVFAGREAELAELDRLAAAWQGQEGDTSVVVVDGAGGMGKTALVLRWAHRAVDLFPDGQLYLNLRGFGPGEPVDPAWAAGALLSTFGAADQEIPAELEARTAMLRTAMAGRRALLVIDNARDVEQVRPLLPGSDAFVVVTSRNQLRGLVSRDGAQRVTVGPLPDEASRELLQTVVPDAPAEAIDELADLCSHVPLALAVAAERVVRSADPGPTDLLVELRDEQSRLDALSSGDDLTTDVRAVLSWSYRTVDPEAARLFRLLSLAPGPDISAPAAAALAARPLGRTRQLLDRLCAAHLLNEASGRRYELHDLVRAYADELATEDADESAAGVRRLLQWYQATAVGARDHLSSNQSLVADPVDDVEPLVLPDRPAALAWFEAERPNLVDAVWLAARSGLDRAAWQIAVALNRYFVSRRPWDHRIPVFECGLECARRAGDRYGEAMSLNSLSDIYHFRGDHDRSVAYCEEALTIFVELDDHPGQVGMHTNMGTSLAEAGDVERALEHHRQAVEAARPLGQPHVMSLVLANLAAGYTAAGRFEEAVTAAREAADQGRATGDPLLEADAWDEIGQALTGMGATTEAIRQFHDALEVYRTFDHPFEVPTLHHLGQAHLAAGSPGRAREVWRRALTRATELGDPLAARLRAELAGLPPSAR